MAQNLSTQTADEVLLLNTLKNNWQNYLKAAEDANAEDKQHWMKLFLFHYQYVHENQHILAHDEVKSFFNPIPEEICSYLLEQVYEIISKSYIFTSAQLARCVATDDDEDDLRITSKKHKIALKRRNHNFAQLILSAPSDCSKIVALRTFLTHELGQHLLQFLLKIDIKASECAMLHKPSSIFEFIRNLTFYQKLKSKNTSNIVNLDTASTNESFVSATSIRKCENFSIEFDNFITATKTSDEIAYILIKLLTKCIANENETSFTEQSMSVISLNFALDCLRRTDDTFGCVDNAEVIKYHLLHLAEKCLNNLFANDDNINAIQFQYVFAKLAAALESNRKSIIINDSIVRVGNDQILCAINFIVFGILHNVIAVHSCNPSICNCKHNLYTMKLIDEHVIETCIQTVKDLLQHNAIDAGQHILLTTIIKTLVRIVDNLCKYDQLAPQNSTLGSSSFQQKLRRRKINLRQMHCRTEMTPTLSWYFQGTLLVLLPHLCADLQGYVMGNQRYLVPRPIAQHWSPSTGPATQLAPSGSIIYTKNKVEIIEIANYTNHMEEAQPHICFYKLVGYKRHTQARPHHTTVLNLDNDRNTSFSVYIDILYFN